MKILDRERGLGLNRCLRNLEFEKGLTNFADSFERAGLVVQLLDFEPLLHV